MTTTSTRSAASSTPTSGPTSTCASVLPKSRPVTACCGVAPMASAWSAPLLSLCAIPGFFPPVSFGGKHYIDGPRWRTHGAAGRREGAGRHSLHRAERRARRRRSRWATGAGGTRGRRHAGDDDHRWRRTRRDRHELDGSACLAWAAEAGLADGRDAAVQVKTLPPPPKGAKNGHGFSRKARSGHKVSRAAELSGAGAAVPGQ